MKANYKNSLVKFANPLNAVPLRGLKRRNQNIFFALISRARDKGTKRIYIPLKKLVQLSGTNYNGHVKRLYHDIKVTYRTLLNITAYQDTPDYFKEGVIFITYKIDKKHKRLILRVNPDMKGILNNLVNQFTRFSLFQFTSLRSSYSKTAFRLIKQYRTTGRLDLTTKEFRRLFCIPKSYSNSSITSRVLRPIIIEVTPLIKDLHIKKTYKGRGGKISVYHFLFKPELHKADDFSHGFERDKQEMYDNVNLNPHLSRRTHDAILSHVESVLTSYKNKINQKKRRRDKRHNHISMPKFHEMVRNFSYNDLRLAYRLAKEHKPSMPLSRYQKQLLRKHIVKHHETTIKKMDDKFNKKNK